MNIKFENKIIYIDIKINIIKIDILNQNAYKMLIIYNNMFSEKNKNYRLNNNEVKKIK